MLSLIISTLGFPQNYLQGKKLFERKKTICKDSTLGFAVLPMMGLCEPPIVAISSDRAGRGPSLYVPADTNTPQRHKKGNIPESLPMDSCPLPHCLAISPRQRWVEFYPVHLICRSSSTLGLSHGIVTCEHTVLSLSLSRIAFKPVPIYTVVHRDIYCSEYYIHSKRKCRSIQCASVGLYNV